jgi:hypothetical protein
MNYTIPLPAMFVDGGMDAIKPNCIPCLERSFDASNTCTLQPLLASSMAEEMAEERPPKAGTHG